MPLKNKRIFVTGGAGVIGQYLVNLLVDAGAIVWVGDLKPRPQTFPPSVLYRQGDLNTLTPEEVASFSPEIIFHLAATFERSEETYGFWEENYKHNVRLSHHIATLVKDLPSLRTYIFASSYLIYDPTLYLNTISSAEPRTLSEDDPISARNLTGSAKLNHEIELQFLHDFLGSRVNFLSARIYRSFGKGSRDVISRWIRAALANESISVFGETAAFDYVYAGDVAQGLLLMAKSPKNYGIYNLATGKAQKVQTVVEVLKSYFPNLRVQYSQSDKPLEASQADMSRFQEAFGWTPPADLNKQIGEIIAYEKLNAFKENPNHGNVLISSASKKIPLIGAVREALNKLGWNSQIIAADTDASCLAREVSDSFWQMPPLAEITPEAFIAQCQELDVKFIIPTRDGELLFFAKNKALFASHGISVMISDSQAVEICLDKFKFYQTLHAVGLPVIETHREIPISLQARTLVVKEALGAGSRSIGLNLTFESAAEHSKSVETPIFQPYIEGRELSADLYLDRHHKTKACMLRWREVVQNGESQVTTTFANPAFEKIITTAAEALGLTGPVVIQAMIDSNQQIHLIEANCRFGGASTLGIAAGVDTFYWFFLEATGQEIANLPVSQKYGLKMVRVAYDFFKACD